MSTKAASIGIVAGPGKGEGNRSTASSLQGWRFGSGPPGVTRAAEVHASVWC
jgi:hypothetical protein